MKRAIFPNAQLLQPIPTTDGVHANISGNINNNTFLPSNNTSTQNIPNTPNNNSGGTTQMNNGTNNFAIFYVVSFLIVVIVIILTYRKVKKK